MTHASQASRRRAALAAALLLGSSPHLLAQQPPVPAARTAEFEVVVARDVMVPVRDGVRMATDVYRPARDGRPVEGRFPALLQRIAYGKGGTSRATEASRLARLGYVVVFQDVRGRFGSEGAFYPYINEGSDGHDTVEWIIKQPWSDGRVGAFGSSYTAGAAHALAVTRPTGLGALFIALGGSNYWEDAAYLGGAPQVLHNLGWSVSHASDEFGDDPAHPVPRMEAGVFSDYLRWLRAPPASHVERLEVMPEFAAFYRDWLEHASYDGYWRQNGYSVEEFYSALPPVPVFYLGGWYDLFLRGTLRNYTALSGAGDREVRLRIGPWTHGGGFGGSPFPEQVDFGPDAGRPDLALLQADWFGRWLRDEPRRGVAAGAPVEIFVMGGGDGYRTAEGRLFHGGRWRSEAEWPLARMRPAAYYLQAGGGLAAQRPRDAPPSAYTYDPDHPAPTIGGNMTHGREVVPMGAADQRCRAEYPHCEDQRPLAERPDVLVFQTEPLLEAVEVTGPIRVRLFVSSSAPDTDFTAKLIDVYPPSPDFPDGFALNLADGVVRARYRDAADGPRPLEPGRTYEVEIDLWATSNLFSAGHRIRLDVSSSNFPRVDANPNTGERVNFHSRTVPAENRIYHDPAHPSHVVLPIVPRAAGTDR